MMVEYTGGSLPGPTHSRKPRSSSLCKYRCMNGSCSRCGCNGMQCGGGEWGCIGNARVRGKCTYPFRQCWQPSGPTPSCGRLKPFSGWRSPHGVSDSGTPSPHSGDQEVPLQQYALQKIDAAEGSSYSFVLRLRCCSNPCRNAPSSNRMSDK
jgi:type 1 fimbria pilin